MRKVNPEAYRYRMLAAQAISNARTLRKFKRFPEARRQECVALDLARKAKEVDVKHG